MKENKTEEHVVILGNTLFASPSSPGLLRPCLRRIACRVQRINAGISLMLALV
ncbi:MAG: hypothetical protein JNN07_26630 [Verrucomicrobiales bacterium]|nr:hypothetical protein [Verrucomicrobiales bacterium]